MVTSRFQSKADYHRSMGIKPKGGYPFGDNLDGFSDYLNLNHWEYVELSPGSIIVHHPLVLHAGADSSVDYCRLSTDIRFVPKIWCGERSGFWIIEKTP